MDKKISNEESIYHLGYELIIKQLNGTELSESEEKFVEYIYRIIDEKIKHLLRKTVTL